MTGGDGGVTTATCNKCERLSKTMTYIIIIRCIHLANTHVGVFDQRIGFVEIKRKNKNVICGAVAKTQLLILVCAKCRYVKIKFVGLPHVALFCSCCANLKAKSTITSPSLPITPGVTLRG